MTGYEPLRNQPFGRAERPADKFKRIQKKWKKVIDKSKDNA